MQMQQSGRQLTRLSGAMLALALAATTFAGASPASASSLLCSVESHPEGVRVSWTAVPGARAYGYKLASANMANRYGTVVGASTVLSVATGEVVTVGVSPRLSDGRSLPRTSCGTARAGEAPQTPTSPTVPSQPTTGVDGALTCAVSAAPGGVRLEVTGVDGAIAYSYKLESPGQRNRYGTVPVGGGFIAVDPRRRVTVGAAPRYDGGRTERRSPCGSAVAGGQDSTPDPEPSSPSPSDPAPSDPVTPAPPAPTGPNPQPEPQTPAAGIPGILNLEGAMCLQTFVPETQMMHVNTTTAARMDTQMRRVDNGTPGASSAAAQIDRIEGASAETRVQIRFVPANGTPLPWFDCETVSERPIDSERGRAAGTRCAIVINTVELLVDEPLVDNPDRFDFENRKVKVYPDATLRFEMDWTLVGPTETLKGSIDRTLGPSRQPSIFGFGSYAFELPQASSVERHGHRLSYRVRTYADGALVDTDVCGAAAVITAETVSDDNNIWHRPDHCMVSGGRVQVDRRFQGDAAVKTIYHLVFNSAGDNGAGPDNKVQTYTRAGLDDVFMRGGLESSDVGVYMQQVFVLRGREVRGAIVNCRIESNPILETGDPFLRPSQTG